MSFLYPRLLSGQARPLHERYRNLRIHQLTELVATRHDSAVYVATGGDRISEQMLQELREQVVDLAQQAGFPDESNRESRGHFDLRLAAVLHSGMGVVPAEASSGDVWAFLALVLLPDVAYWRYPRPPGDRVLGTDLTRHVFGRMWWRAQLVHATDDPAPYSALSVLGEAAFDQIYARRKALGGSPHLVRAILRVWAGLDLRPLNERDALRNFLMRLLRLGPFVLFEALDEQSLDAELRVVLRETLQALLTAGGATEEEREQRIEEVFAAAQAVASTPETGLVSKKQPEATESTTLVPQQDGIGSNNTSLLAGGPESMTRFQAYTRYDGPGFGDPREIGLHACAEALLAVVETEGPVKATRAYRIITQLAGTRLRSAATSALVQATRYAVRKGMLQAEGQRGRGGFPGSTLRVPGQPDCILRERGPRMVEEIPDREIVAAASLIQSSERTMDLDVLAKKTSLLFGYEKVSGNFKEILVEALERHSR
ncbi:DUF6339 family protein [Actinomadura livida]|uniref:Uncharacterized protein n=1 Tax=Actinomadura livida TaxID=79909 RepID=A0A7W7I8C7_9ACTN|nr:MULTISPECIES: DUF6339 family protein [Actinomadura]MBB4772359.1 hypothetical protein [Actinomadura catellatispora]GGU23521.1 hypothetical protein GCM10010208_55760 [Actinomadura livida]